MSLQFAGICHVRCTTGAGSELEAKKNNQGYHFGRSIILDASVLHVVCLLIRLNLNWTFKI